VLEPVGERGLAVRPVVGHFPVPTGGVKLQRLEVHEKTAWMLRSTLEG
jgi:hypothetical protein